MAQPIKPMKLKPPSPVVPADGSAGWPHFSALTPDLMLDAMASIGLYGEGGLMALSSYENRVYLLRLEQACQGHDSVVVKFYRPGRWSQAQIAEEHAFAAELMADEIPMIGPLLINGSTLHQYQGFAFSVSPRRGGRAPELDDFEVLEWTGRLLARIHNVGARRAFAHRPAINVRSFAIEPRDWLLAHEGVAPEVRGQWRHSCQAAIDWLAQYAALSEHPVPQGIRLHADCHPGNILWTPEGAAGAGPHFVDLDDARSGPAVQDLWMLLSGDRRQRNQQLSALLEGYEQVRAFDRRELALIEPLRTLRLIHYSAWLARRFDEGIFKINFPWFGTPDYWQGQVHMLDEQLQAMQDDAAGGLLGG